MSRRAALSRPAVLIAVALLVALCVAVSPLLASADLLIAPEAPAEQPASDSVAQWGALGPVLAALGLSLGLTLLVEVPVVAVASRWNARATTVAILVNTLTNPIVFLVVLAAGLEVARYGFAGVFAGIVALEIAVAVIEWRLYRWVLGWSERRAFLTSALANVMSFCLGVVLTLWRAS